MRKILRQHKGEYMKKSKLSLVAALALTTGLQAADIKYDERLGITTAVDQGYTERKEKESTIVFDGQLRFWYQTMDHGGTVGGQSDKGLFRRDTNMGNEWGNVEAQFSISGQVNERLKAKGTFMAVSTMGMENLIVVGQTARTGAQGALDGRSAQPFWVHEAYLDYLLTENTDVKVGRMELDTPLIYTEKWNATANSFEAITATNTDLANTTITAAYVAKGNGAQQNLRAAPQVFGAEATFNSLMGYADVGSPNAGGALVLGATSKAIDFMPVQAWGYAIQDAAMGYWLQADPSVKNVGPLDSAALSLVAGGLGTQGATERYLQNNPMGKPTVGGVPGQWDQTGDQTQMTHALAAKIGATAGIFNAYAAASSVSKGNLPVANIGTNFKKTKLPTASVFNDGMVVAQPDTNTWKVGGGAKFEGIGTLNVSYGSSTVGQNGGYQNPNAAAGGPAGMGWIVQNYMNESLTVNEFDIIFNTKVKDVDIAAMYIKVNNTYVPRLGAGGGPAAGEAFANYGEFSNDIVRIVATLKF